MSLSILVDAPGWTLLHFLWQGAAIALFLAVGLRFAMRSVPQVRYAMACGGLMLMAGMMAMTLGWELSGDIGSKSPHVGTPTAFVPGVAEGQPTHVPPPPVASGKTPMAG